MLGSIRVPRVEVGGSPTGSTLIGTSEWRVAIHNTRVACAPRTEAIHFMRLPCGPIRFIANAPEFL